MHNSIHCYHRRHTLVNQLPDPDDIIGVTGSNVTKFRGKFEGIRWAELQAGRTPQLIWTYLDTKFIQAAIVPSTKQFSFQTPVNMEYMSGDRWAAVVSSFTAVTRIDRPKFSKYKGTWWTCEYKPIPGRTQKDGEWVDGTIQGWVVTEVEGIGETTPEAVVPATSEVVDDDTLFRSIAIGKNPTDFMEAAMVHEQVKGKPALDRLISDSEGVLEMHIEAGTLVLNEATGLYEEVK